MSKVAVSFQDFKTKFFTKDSPLVRVHIDLAAFEDQFKRAEGSIVAYNHESPPAWLKKRYFYAPWHVSLHDHTPAMPSVNTRAILLNSISDEEQYMHKHHTVQIDAICDWLASDPTSPIVLEVVTLRVSKRHYVVLDGNHRLSALIKNLESRPHGHITVREYRINMGVVSPDLLPDVISFYS